MVSAAEMNSPSSNTIFIGEEITMKERPGIRKDIWRMVVVVFLSALGSSFNGLTALSAQLALNDGVGHIEQVMLLVPLAVTWNLFWTPILSFPIIPTFGCRLTWVLAFSGQAIISVVLLLRGSSFLLAKGGALSILLLSFMYSLVNVLSHIQTIEVHKWASKVLQPCNVRYTSIWIGVGQYLGYTLVLFGWNFINKETIITQPGFISGLTFLVNTCLVYFIKKDNVQTKDQELNGENQWQFQDLKNLVCMRQVQILAGVQLVYTCITRFTAESNSDQPLEISYMNTIVIASARIIILIVQLNTGSGLEDIDKAILFRSVLYTTLLVIVLALVVSNFSCTWLNVLMAVGNHSFYNFLLYCIMRSRYVPNQEDNGTYKIFITTLLESADELYFYCLTSFISKTISL